MCLSVCVSVYLGVALCPSGCGFLSVCGVGCKWVLGFGVGDGKLIVGWRGVDGQKCFLDNRWIDLSGRVMME